MPSIPENPSQSTGDPDHVYDGAEIQLLMFLPFMGPGVNTETGQLAGPPQETYVMHATQLRLKPDPEALQRFEQQSAHILEQLAKSQGLLGFAFGFEPRRNLFRTMGVWRSAEAMDAFTNHGTHQQVMSEADLLSFHTIGHHWEVPASEMPPRWEAAIAGLAKRDAGAGSAPPTAVTVISLVERSEAGGKTPYETFLIGAERLRRLAAAAGAAP